MLENIVIITERYGALTERYGTVIENINIAHY